MQFITAFRSKYRLESLFAYLPQYCVQPFPV